MVAFLPPVDLDGLTPEQKAPPALVHFISLSDESISPALRGHTPSIEQILAEISSCCAHHSLPGLVSSDPEKGPLTLPLDEAENLINFMLWGDQSDASLRDSTQAIALGLLRDIAEHLPDGTTLPEQLRHANTEHELVAVLEYASSSQRLSFVSTLLDAAGSNPQAADFLMSKLDNAMYFLSAQEEGALLRHALQSENDYTRAFGAVLLRGSRTLADLKALVEEIGTEALLTSSSVELRELAAIAVLYSSARADTLPSSSNELSNKLDLFETIHSLTNFLDRRHLEVNQDARLAESIAAQEMSINIAQARSDLETLSKKLSSISESESLGTLSQELRTLQLRMELEFKYGIQLTAGVDDEGARLTEWSFKELGQVRSALERLPEGMLLTTPMLFEIQRVSWLGDSVLGVREHTGRIRIAQLAVENPMVEFMYPGATSLERTLIHEIGHALQLGNSSGGVGLDRSFRLAIEQGDVRYDFDEFVALSGWELIARERFSVEHGGLSVTLDGVPCPIGVPVQVHDRILVLLPVHGFLFAHDAGAGFSLVPYSRTNPWEDWAEAFAEYFTAPERLRAFAPAKFEFLDREFRYHWSNASLAAVPATH